MTKIALILHGTDASPADNWFAWLRTNLLDQGYDKVWLPQLPDSSNPSTATYNKFLLSAPDFQIDELTTLIGHSSGAVEILSLLQQLPDGIQAGDVYLVSAFCNNLGWKSLDGLFVEPYNYAYIQTKAHSITLVHSDDDPYVPIEQAEFLAAKLDARLVIISGQGHFNTEKSAGYTQFPALVQIMGT